MNETRTQMRVRHAKEIADLQASCGHPRSEWSTWMGESWAPGHMTGYQVRVCELCGREVDRNPKETQ
jgi:hypothetical protein